ncbi:MAG TPA: hypothetical protein VKT77_23730, partial [Chthonomonadaceae bacterium]|nr:hypothetical protein [Chthonomonadaceae bacterium]
MRFQRNSNGDTFVLSPSDLVGSGGEARVYVVPPESRYVAKVYHRPTETQVRKLRVMVENPPEDPAREQGHISIAWPLDLVTLAYGERRFAGYLMPRVVETRPLFRVYNPGVRRRGARHVDYVYLHRIARNLSAAVRALHARGYVIGDINESNILVTSSALITLVDTDSFQVRDPHSGVTYRCPVGKPEYTPPELQGKRFIHIDRAPEHDRFGLAVLIFQLLMEGAHPYAGLYGGAGEPPPYEERIAHGWFSFGSRSGPIRPMPAAPGFELLSPELRGLFLRCFEDGFSDPAARPDAQIWQSALASAERALVCCARNPMHLYGSHLSACPWCERKELLGGRDPFPALDARDDGPMRRVGAASLLPATPAFGGYSAGRSAGAFVPAPAIASGGAAVMSWQSAQPLSASAGPAGAIALPTPTLFSMKLEGGGWAGIALFWAALAVCAAPLGLAGLNLLMALLSAACAAAGWMLGAKGPKAARWTCALSACAAFASIAMRPPEPPMLTAVAPLVAGRGAVRSLDFSPDGARLAAGTARVEDSSLTEGALDIWDIAGSRLLLTPERSSGDVVSVAFAPNGSFLVAGTDSPFGTGEVTLVNATATGAYNSVVKLRSYIRRVAWSPDGRLLAAAGDDRIVRVFDSATLQLA